MTGGPGGGDPGPGGDSTTSLALGSIGVASALCGPVVAIVAIFSLSNDAKIFWSIALTAAAFLVGGALFVWLRTRQRVFGIALVAAVLLNVGLILGVSVSYQRVVDTARLACLAPGEGGGPFTAAFRDAFARKGGTDVFGCGTSRVSPLGGGMHQNFTSPDGSLAVIFAIEPGVAVALDPDDWIGYHSVRGPVETTTHAGFPFAEPQVLVTGKILEIGAGPGSWPRTAVVKRTGGTWFWVQGMWPCYQTRFGGPEGELGYPIDSQEYDEGRRLPFQRFEHGVLYYDEHRGVLTERELEAGSGVGCSIPSARIALTDVYRVEASPGGVPHEINPLGYVEQEFIATTETIDELAVTVGLDPKSDSGGPHSLSIELRSGGTIIVSEKTVPLVNNGRTSVRGNSTPLTIGSRYTLRVTNASDDVLGFYLNSGDSPGSTGSSGCRAHLVGEKPEPAPHDATACLSALVRGH